jgi:hypothetical protein
MNALYSLYDALVSINVPADKARAVVSAMEHDMTTLLATKADLSNTQLLLKQELAAVRDSLQQEIGALRDSVKKDLELLQSSMTIRLGTIMVVSMGLLLGALRLMLVR